MTPSTMAEVFKDIDFGRRVAAGEIAGIIPAGTTYVPKPKPHSKSIERREAFMASQQQKDVNVTDSTAPAAQTPNPEPVQPQETAAAAPSSDATNPEPTPPEATPREKLEIALKESGEVVTFAENLHGLAVRTKKDLWLKKAAEEVRRWRQNGHHAIEGGATPEDMLAVVDILAVAVKELRDANDVIFGIFKLAVGRVNGSLKTARDQAYHAKRLKGSDIEPRLRTAIAEVEAKKAEAEAWRDGGFPAPAEGAKDAIEELDAANNALWTVLREAFRGHFDLNVSSIRHTLQDIEWSKGKGYWDEKDEERIGDLRARVNTALDKVGTLTKDEAVPAELGNLVRGLSRELEDHLNYNRFPNKLEALASALRAGASLPNKDTELNKLLSEASDLKAKAVPFIDKFPIPARLHNDVAWLGKRLWERIEAKRADRKALEQRLRGGPRQ